MYVTILKMRRLESSFGSIALHSSYTRQIDFRKKKKGKIKSSDMSVLMLLVNYYNY